MAPEANTSSMTTAAADMFSLGCLMCWLHERPVIDAHRSFDAYTAAVNRVGGLHAYQIPIVYAQASNFVHGMREQFDCVSLVDALVRMLSRQPMDRPTAQMFSLVGQRVSTESAAHMPMQIAYFDDPLVSTLHALDSLHTMDASMRTHFITSTLTDTLAHMPQVRQSCRQSCALTHSVYGCHACCRASNANCNNNQYPVRIRRAPVLCFTCSPTAMATTLYACSRTSSA
jgi:hypothetical protein